MKKIVMVAAIAAVIFSVSASSFTWGMASGDYTSSNGDTLTSGTIFLYTGTVTASASAFDASAATLITYDGYNEDQGVFGNIDTDNLSSSDALASTVAQPYTLILLEKSGVTDLSGYEGHYYMLTGTSSQESIPGGTTTFYGDFTDYDTVVTANSWSTMSVPEPTSGLLLLLGMAGLALKRKIA